MISRGGSYVLFVIVLFCYTVQTELVQWVIGTGYSKPCFLLYLTHSGYIFVIPLHLVLLKLTGIPIRKEMRTLHHLLRRQFSNAEDAEEGRRWYGRLLQNVLILMCLITLPALCWYLAVGLTSMTNITALNNTSAFVVYLLALRFLGERYSTLKMAAVLLSVFGVFVIAFGDITFSGAALEDDVNAGPTSRLIGNGMAVVGSISYACYEVFYKLNISLPTSFISASSDEEDASKALLATPLNHSTHLSSPPPPPVSNTTFLLHSNAITTLVGLSTITILWIPLVFLHVFSLETFVMPPSELFFPILGIIFTGVTYNASFMLLLSLWGPVLASVGSLCTLISVAFADTVILGYNLGVFTQVGSGIVIMAFLLLAFAKEEMFKEDGRDPRVEGERERERERT